MALVPSFLHAPGRALVVLASLAAGLAALPAQASGRNDHERALQAVQSGQVLPLRTVLDRLAREQPGEVLEVELEQEDGRWVYEVRLLQPDGALVKLELDARTAAILRRKPHDKRR